MNLMQYLNSLPKGDGTSPYMPKPKKPGRGRSKFVLDFDELASPQARAQEARKERKEREGL